MESLLLGVIGFLAAALLLYVGYKSNWKGTSHEGQARDRMALKMGGITGFWPEFARERGLENIDRGGVDGVIHGQYLGRPIRVTASEIDSITTGHGQSEIRIFTHVRFDLHSGWLGTNFHLDEEYPHDVLPSYKWEGQYFFTDEPESSILTALSKDKITSRLQALERELHSLSIENGQLSATVEEIFWDSPTLDAFLKKIFDLAKSLDEALPEKVTSTAEHPAF